MKFHCNVHPTFKDVFTLSKKANMSIFCVTVYY